MVLCNIVAMAKAKTKARPREVRVSLIPDGWRSQVGLLLYKHKLGVRLVVGCSQDVDGRWLVLAVETPETGLHQALANHAHEFVGKFDLVQAVAAAERYAKAWKPGTKPACACDDITAAARPTRAGRGSLPKRGAPGKNRTLRVPDDLWDKFQAAQGVNRTAEFLRREATAFLRREAR